MKKYLLLFCLTLLFIAADYKGCNGNDPYMNYITVSLNASGSVYLQDSPGGVPYKSGLTENMRIDVTITKGYGVNTVMDATVNELSEFVVNNAWYNLYEGEPIVITAEPVECLEGYKMNQACRHVLNWTTVKDSTNYGETYEWNPCLDITLVKE